MNDSIANRGPDSQGTWIDMDDRIAFGHCRLSIQDLSEAGHQSMIIDMSSFLMAKFITI